MGGVEGGEMGGMEGGEKGGVEGQLCTKSKKWL